MQRRNYPSLLVKFNPGALATACLVAISAAAFASACGLDEGGFGANSPGPGINPGDSGGVKDGGPKPQPGPGGNPIGGMVSGLEGQGLVLQNNEGDDLPISADGAFIFPTGIPVGGTYAVRIKPGTQPKNAYQECKVENGRGTMGEMPVGDISVECVLLPSCKVIKEKFGQLPNGAYRISPEHDAPATLHCDMSFEGGGWSLIVATTNRLGPQDLVAAEWDQPLSPGSGKYLPLEKMKALAAGAKQVHIREADKLERFLTSVADAEPIANLRQGHVANQGLETAGTKQVSLWTGSQANARVLQFNCAATALYPAIYWACGNQDGMHVVRQISVWDHEGESPNKNVAMDVYVR